MPNAGGSYLYPVPASNEPLDPVTDMSELAAGVDASMASAAAFTATQQAITPVTLTGWAEAGFTESAAGSGTPFDAHRQGDLVSVDVSTKYTKAINIPANGDIVNFSIFSIPDAANRPRYEVPFQLVNLTDKLVAFGVVSSAGIGYLVQIHSYTTTTSSVALAAGSVWHNVIRWSLATA